jgi:hypothetical protein
VNCVQSNDNDISQRYGRYLSNIVHLPNVNQIKFEPCIFAGQWKDIQFMLQ